jgi:hypothetical protein
VGAYTVKSVVGVNVVNNITMEKLNSKSCDCSVCDNIECHMERDLLETIIEAMEKLPCNTIQSILVAAYQEISYWRGL